MDIYGYINIKCFHVLCYCFYYKDELVAFPTNYDFPHLV